jgi:Plasma-membrane choline transporter
MYVVGIARVCWANQLLNIFCCWYFVVVLVVGSVQCAIFGTPFCESGRKAFFLILRNASTVGALGMVSGGVLWIGKVLISTLTTTL